MIRDGDVLLAESGAIIEYVIAKHGGGRLRLAPSDPHFARYLFWLHYAEGSLMLPILRERSLDRMPPDPEAAPGMARVRATTRRHLDFVEDALTEFPYFAGEAFTGADIMMAFPFTTPRVFLTLDLSPFPALRAYLARIETRPAYREAMDLAGPDKGASPRASRPPFWRPTMTANTDPVWFITGCSTGFGRELAKLVLASGGRAVVTARDKSRVADLAEGAGERALLLDLDVTNHSQIDAAVVAADERFGAIDVLVNNAGYGYQATAEEGEDAEIRKQFDANVFGLFAMTRAVLPGMRARRQGHIVNITSVAGLVGFPGSGYYAASKHAVEGWSDALAAEVKPLDIKVTCVEPGPFRTDWAGRSLIQTPTQIADYAETAGARLKGAVAGSGKQPGDPVRAARAIMRLVGELGFPPRHLVLGKFGYRAVTEALERRLTEVKAWEDWSLRADFPAKEPTYDGS